MVGVAVFFHVAVVKRPLWVQQDAHVVVCVIPPPDAHAGCRVEAQVLPGTPQGGHAGDGFGVEVPLDAPLCGLPGDAADVGGQQLLVKELFGRAVEELRCLLRFSVFASAGVWGRDYLKSPTIALINPTAATAEPRRNLARLRPPFPNSSKRGSTSLFHNSASSRPTTQCPPQ